MTGESSPRLNPHPPPPIMRTATVGLWEVPWEQARIFGDSAEDLVFGSVPVRASQTTGELYIDTNGIPPQALAVYQRLSTLVPGLSGAPLSAGVAGDRRATLQEIYSKTVGPLSDVPPLSSVIGSPSTLEEAWNNWQQIAEVDEASVISLQAFADGLPAAINNAAASVEDFSANASGYWDRVSECFGTSGIGWIVMFAFILAFAILCSVLSGGTFAVILATLAGILITIGVGLGVAALTGFLLCLISATGIVISS